LLAGLGTLLLVVAGSWWLARPEAAAPAGSLRDRAARDADAAAVPDGPARLDAREAGAVAALLPDAGAPLAPADVAPAAPTPPPRPGNAATFHGVVTDESGRPVGESVVWYLPNVTTLKAWQFPCHPAGSIPADVPLDGLPHVRTGSDGRFAIESTCLPAPVKRPGSNSDDMNRPYAELIVTHPDFAAVSHECRGFAGGDYDAGAIALAPGLTLAGRTVDEAGAPLAGVRIEAPGRSWTVTATRGQILADGLSSFYRTASGEDGRFALPGLPPGSGTASFRAVGRLEKRMFTGKTVMADGRLDLGDVVLESGVALAGRVLDANGTPLAGAEIWASAEAHPAQMTEGDVILDDLNALRKAKKSWRATCGEDGAFMIRGLPAGRYFAFAQAPGFEPACSALMVAGAEPIDVVLSAAATLAVAVVDDETSAPLAGAEVTACRVAKPGEPHTQQVLEVLSGDAARAAGGAGTEGVFLVRPAGPIGTAVLASAPGHQVVTQMVDGLSAGKSRALTLRLRSEEPAMGRVVDASGAPVQSADVTVYPLPGNSFGREKRVLQTDAAGSYTLSGVSAGAWRLTARAPDGASSQKPVEVTLPLQPPGPLPDLVLGATGTVSGRVVDRAGRPVPGARVSLNDEATQKSWLTAVADRDGAFVVSGVAPGVTRVAASELHAEAKVDVVAGATAEVLLVERKSALLHGRVLAAGRPVPGATVRSNDGGAWSSGGRADPWGRTCKTDDFGAWQLESRAGNISLLAETNEGGLSGTAALRVDWDTDVAIDLEMGSIPLDCLVAEDPGGKPRADAEVVVSAPDGRFQLVRKTGADGHAQFAGLVPGDYVARVRLKFYMEGPFVRFTVAPGQSRAEVTVPFIAGATVRGTLRAADGKPVPDGTVVTGVCEAEPNTTWADKTKDAKYEFTDLAPGTWQFTVRSVTWMDNWNETEKPLATQAIQLEAGAERTLDFTIDYGP